jgi:hypothetical protein
MKNSNRIVCESFRRGGTQNVSFRLTLSGCVYVVANL